MDYRANRNISSKPLKLSLPESDVTERESLFLRTIQTCWSGVHQPSRRGTAAPPREIPSQESAPDKCPLTLTLTLTHLIRGRCPWVRSKCHDVHETISGTGRQCPSRTAWRPRAQPLGDEGEGVRTPSKNGRTTPTFHVAADCSARNWVYHPYFVLYNNLDQGIGPPTLKTWLRPWWRHHAKLI